MISAIDIIDSDLNDEPNSKNMVVSIDFEWPIYDFGSVKGNISVAQIGLNLSNGKRHRLVLSFGLHTNNWQIIDMATAILSTGWCFIYWEDDCK